MDAYTAINNLQKYFTRERLILAFVILFFVVGVSWCYRHSYIEVTAQGPIKTGESITYSFKNQSTKKTDTVESTSKTVRKFVLRGSYEVTVDSKTGNHFKISKAKGLLQTTYIKAPLQPEKSRTFVGNSPSPCMYYGGEILYSYSCSGSYDDLQAHLPASGTTPTTVKSPPRGTSLPFGGIARVGDINMMMVKTSESDRPQTKLFPVSPALSLTDGVALKGLDSDAVYSMQQLKGGLIAYSEEFGDLSYFADVNSAPKKLSIDAPDNEEVSPSSISAHDDRVAVVYSTSATDGDLDSNEPLSGTTIVQISKVGSDETQSFTFDGVYTYVKLCGTQQLCLVSGRQLTVYDTVGDKLEKMYELTDVYAIENDGNNLIVLTDQAALGLDVASASGSIQYDYGEYDLCGSQAVSEGGYVLCLTNSHDDRVALYINTRENDTNTIDKKILDMYKNPDIDTVSAYKNYIYVTPRLGELEYNAAKRGYSYSPEEIEKTKASILKSVEEYKIDTKQFTVINPYSSL